METTILGYMMWGSVVQHGDHCFTGFADITETLSHERSYTAPRCLSAARHRKAYSQNYGPLLVIGYIAAPNI